MSQKPEFEQLVAEHSREMHAYLWRMLQDNHEAEDCLQDTFVRAYKAYNRLRPDSNYRAWLYKIATNVALTHLKKRGRQQARTADVNPALVSDGPTPSDRVERREFLGAVMQAVEGLPHKQRSALMMRKFQGLSYAEIGKALKSSEGAARANVYQALKKLRSQLTEQE